MVIGYTFNVVTRFYPPLSGGGGSRRLPDETCVGTPPPRAPLSPSPAHTPAPHPPPASSPDACAREGLEGREREEDEQGKRDCREHARSWGSEVERRAGLGERPVLNQCEGERESHTLGEAREGEPNLPPPAAAWFLEMISLSCGSPTNAHVIATPCPGSGLRLLGVGVERERERKRERER